LEYKTDENEVNLDEGLEHELEEIKQLTKENNKMLHSIQRRARVGVIMRVIYWTVILGAAVGAFYFVQPYIDEVTNTYKGIKSTQEKATDFTKNFSWGSIQDYFTGTSTAQ
jgi:hypothetical protein